jgi:VanZ family protein
MVDGGSSQGSWALVAGLNLVYAALIGGLALIPDPPSTGVTDWQAHALAFGGQTILLYSLLGRHWASGRSLATAAAGALSYGLLIEVLQLLVSSRYFELTDLLANLVGVTLASVVLAVMRLLRQRLRGRAEG